MNEAPDTSEVVSPDALIDSEVRAPVQMVTVGTLALGAIMWADRRLGR